MKKKHDLIEKASFTGFVAVLLACGVLFSGCELVQSSLSSVQKEKLLEATGNPSYNYKVWYYNGTSGEDMNSSADSASNDYFVQTMRIDFGRKVALSAVNPSGKIVINYTDAQGNSLVKTITSLGGRLSSDYESYYLDMTPVTKIIDGITASASVDLKLSGFVCAEGNQQGRPLAAFELSGLSVRPLYDSVQYDFSTIGFESQIEYSIPLKASVSLEKASVDVTAKDTALKEYDFTVTAGEKELILKPKFSTRPEDGTKMTLAVSGIMAEGSGDYYTKEFILTFTKNLIVIDGIQDSNYTSESAAYAQDAEGDSYTNNYDGASDITQIFATNDEDYFYVGIKGALTVDWYDGLFILISKDHSYDASIISSSKEDYGFVSSGSFGRETLAHGKPDFYLFHRPYFSELVSYVENTEKTGEDKSDDISSSILASDITGGTFVEYAIPMSELLKAGITSLDKVYIAAGFSAHWDEGVFLSDIAPDGVVTFTDTVHKNATLNMKNALEFTLN